MDKYLMDKYLVKTVLNILLVVSYFTMKTVKVNKNLKFKKCFKDINKTSIQKLTNNLKSITLIILIRSNIIFVKVH